MTRRVNQPRKDKGMKNLLTALALSAVLLATPAFAAGAKHKRVTVDRCSIVLSLPADAVVRAVDVQACIKHILLTLRQSPQVVNMGTSGSSGPKGADGTNGTNGQDGEDGATGPQGPQGDQGPVGPIGPEGPQGEQGPGCPGNSESTPACS